MRKLDSDASRSFRPLGENTVYWVLKPSIGCLNRLLGAYRLLGTETVYWVLGDRLLGT